MNYLVNTHHRMSDLLKLRLEISDGRDRIGHQSRSLSSMMEASSF